MYNKLLLSKWTSIEKKSGWFHYQVINIMTKDKEVELFAICNKKTRIFCPIKDLKNTNSWGPGWKDL